MTTEAPEGRPEAEPFRFPVYGIPDVNATLQKNVRSRRIQQNLSPEQLAAKGKLRLSVITNLEGGKRRPQTSVIERIANALGCKPAELYATQTS